MRPYFYILSPERSVLAVEPEVWAVWMSSMPDRQVGLDEVAPGVAVSTVFLSLDHNWFDDGPPILFETMIFDDYEDGAQWRYSTWEEAEAGHRARVEELRQRVAARQQNDCN